jgi:hypothetical protein
LKHPEKWRETIDVNSLIFKHIEVVEVLGYPHAGNDVFHAKVIHQGIETTAFIKVERQFGADISNEIDIISKLPYHFCPKILDYSLEDPKFIATEEVIGERLSYIFAKNPDTDVRHYLSKQASVLSDIHGIKLNCELVKDRKFFFIPTGDYCAKRGIDCVHEFLISNEPMNPEKCFVHGDFHYANILWRNFNISCVLDYELSGYGIREFDMAWSVFLRPGQKFPIFMGEVEAFLKGYKKPYNPAMFYYYYVLIATHFYPLNDDEYKGNVDELISGAIKLYNSQA